MAKYAYIVIALLSISLELVLTGPTALGSSSSSGHGRLKRESKPEFVEDLEEYANEWAEKLWGGRCIADDNCLSPISYCHKESMNVEGECRMVWWFMLILALIAVFIISAIVSCICCPCCFLYNCCRNICDCLCCCCKSNRGYSPARN